MKNLYLLFSGILIFSLVTGCGSNKELQERAPAQFQQVYYQNTDDGLKLFIPVAAIQDNRVELNSVYFRGMKSDLKQDEDRQSLYVANFSMGGSDYNMSEKPEGEYGNKAPQKPEKAPAKIEDDEAILVFSQNGQIKYYKLTGIVEKD
ncbi:MAG: hypothetical protein WAM00_07020 [Salegentibacter sp.]